MRILIAPNAFKNSLSAFDAAQAIAAGLANSRLRGSWAEFPIADGGDGTGELLLRRLGGTSIAIEVQDPLGRKISAPLGWIKDSRRAVIEMADASGLRLLRTDELDPLSASSFGTGELIRAALDQGAREIVLGVGGSATMEGGVGILRALGVRFLDRHGQGLPEGAAALSELASIDSSALDPRLAQCSLTVVCDVVNVLLGPSGAAAVFGPQKGATSSVVAEIEAALANFAAVVLRQTGKDMTSIVSGGAAGGVAAGLWALMGAKLAPGIDFFLGATGFDAALGDVDLVITGEGRIDEQTLHGKGPHGVALRAKARGIPVVAFAGSVSPTAMRSLQEYFDALLPIGAGPADLAQALRNTASDLERAAHALGNLLALKMR
jgi:glycerate 2-kinase